MPQELIYGPLNKNMYTQEFELIAKSLLRDPNNASFHIQKTAAHDKSLILTLDHHSYNVSDIFHKANLSHVKMDSHDSHYYTQFLTHEALNVPQSPYNFFAYDHYALPHFPDNPRYENLSYGEKCAINVYTGSFFQVLNTFLHGDVTVLEAWKAYPDHFQTLAKEIVLHTAMMSSGLNEIDPTSNPEDVYRGERSISNHHMEERHDVIMGKEVCTNEPAFMSTSSDPYIAINFSSDAYIHFINNAGKNISELSMFPMENEYLMLPGQVKWLSETKIGDNTLYTAEKICVLDDFIESIPTQQERAQVKALTEFSSKTHIPVEDVLTDYNKTLLFGDTHQTPHLHGSTEVTPMDVLSPTNDFLPVEFAVDQYQPHSIFPELIFSEATFSF
ncbi:MAG TPA: ADP-ribosyltransferase domain-containing protein [Gammaproteobacteria bacterium]|nr:ADP-ribosyltransferase domain-containing protein [Gammaproteobacteria bacterium]